MVTAHGLSANETQNSHRNVCPLLSNNSELTATPAEAVLPHEPRISPRSPYKIANTVLSSIRTRKLLEEELGLSMADAEAINQLTGTFDDDKGGRPAQSRPPIQCLLTPHACPRIPVAQKSTGVSLGYCRP
ncbi:hypothetical protein PtA15_18A107 [Puccinia triticina]|uniref:Uncharacterized protein n=1 Tax=Puccinia triticina TaxID=208348 RepID=A0ABY7D5W4_9BASI|nr:uncharacterized protein PtA15_18A107 [Puccinia triticina]WAQ93051.1 hypothetical protein PtA15_18A107 [Puccinia triticina]